jgi:NADPH:quinone reductase-like Zn-dependent oxidoreductase
MPRTVRAYAVTSEAIRKEKERVGGDLEKVRLSNILKLDTLTLPDPGPKDVRIRILAVSAEHNIIHMGLADTVDITTLRGGKIYPGNSAVGEVVETGSMVEKFRVGDIVITHCNGAPDPYGYPLRIWAYDQPESIGWYAEEAVVGEWQILPAPLTCGLSLWEIAALPLRAPTAYHLWRRAIDIYRIKVPREKKGVLNVLSFGGGVGELFLMQAKSEGHRAYFCSGNPERRKALEKMGIIPIDQNQFNRFRTPEDIQRFEKHIREITNGEKMQIVCDMLRGPVFEAGISALSREGVNVSAGWQLNKMVRYDSAMLSVKQITLDHTHYETIDGSYACLELYGTVYKPVIHKEIYPFEDLPKAFDELQDNTVTGIPIIRVAKDLPEKVRHLT